MRTISLCAIAVAVIAIGLGVWTTSTSTHAVPSVGQGIDPSQMMTNARGLATAELVDYTFVFH